MRGFEIRMSDVRNHVHVLAHPAASQPGSSVPTRLIATACAAWAVAQARRCRRARRHCQAKTRPLLVAHETDSSARTPHTPRSLSPRRMSQFAAPRTPTASCSPSRQPRGWPSSWAEGRRTVPRLLGATGQPVGQARVEGRVVSDEARTEAIRSAMASGGGVEGSRSRSRGRRGRSTGRAAADRGTTPHSARGEEVEGSLGGGDSRTPSGLPGGPARCTSPVEGRR